MTQSSLERQIARATGESLATIRRLGFSLACPALVSYDPEPVEDEVDHSASGASGDEHRGPNVIDWDEVDAQRMSIFPAHYGRVAA